MLMLAEACCSTIDRLNKLPFIALMVGSTVINYTVLSGVQVPVLIVHFLPEKVLGTYIHGVLLNGS